jgi:hypothetical protein
MTAARDRFGLFGQGVHHDICIQEIEARHLKCPERGDAPRKPPRDYELIQWAVIRSGLDVCGHNFNQLPQAVSVGSQSVTKLEEESAEKLLVDGVGGESSDYSSKPSIFFMSFSSISKLPISPFSPIRALVTLFGNGT